MPGYTHVKGCSAASSTELMCPLATTLQVEIVARCCRKWDPSDDELLDDEVRWTAAFAA